MPRKINSTGQYFQVADDTHLCACFCCGLVQKFPDLVQRVPGLVQKSKKHPLQLICQAGEIPLPYTKNTAPSPANQPSAMLALSALILYLPAILLPMLRTLKLLLLYLLSNKAHLLHGVELLGRRGMLDVMLVAAMLFNPYAIWCNDYER
ncbi:paraquat-inducible protein A [Candidatus Venteria ishoeyi]|uniref:Uncharacterized protein n=1 Tax=Candidatus Venteria ishoeyi TaxID=1899563 RepID=A0A1H6FFH1_9GAMM|nr:hypothetical protein [Candidatus Venteria ishoeyi]SEH07754.1 Uncharacterised protein [Candidatus Venteria ishoeyi]